MSLGGTTAVEGTDRGLRLKHSYVRPLARLGRRELFSSNRHARFAFMTTLRALERRFGAPTEPKWVTTRSGARFFCHLRDNLESELYYLGSYAAPELEKVARHLGPGDVFLDVGGHVGLFAVEMARQVGPAGRVIAFEPSFDSALALRRNAEANGVGAIVEVFEVALGEGIGKLPLRAAKDHPFDGGRRSLFADGPTISHVPVRALDDLVEAGEIVLDRGLQAIKIDVEGNELSAIRGMQRTLTTQRPRVVLVETVEANLRRAGTSKVALTEYMRGLGYLPAESVECPASLDTTFVPAQVTGP